MTFEETIKAAELFQKHTYSDPRLRSQLCDKYQPNRMGMPCKHQENITPRRENSRSSSTRCKQN
jgi:hypothetical protein